MSLIYKCDRCATETNKAMSYPTAYEADIIKDGLKIKVTLKPKDYNHICDSCRDAIITDSEVQTAILAELDNAVAAA